MSENLPKVDLILPFHRNDDFLMLAIDSLYSTEGVRLRVILVDDRAHSEVDYPSVKLNNLEYVKTSGREGYGKAIQAGLKLVKSEYLAFMDSDDVSDINRIRLQIEDLKSKKADISTCKMIKIDSAGRRIFDYLEEIQEPVNQNLPLLFGSYGANSTWVIPYDSLGKFNFYRSETAFDWAVALASVKNINQSHLNLPLYKYRQHKNQMTQVDGYMEGVLVEIYPLWRELNNACGLPTLEERDFVKLNSPYGLVRVTPESAAWVEEVVFQAIHKRQENIEFYQLMATRIFMKSDLIGKQRIFSSAHIEIINGLRHLVKSRIRYARG